LVKKLTKKAGITENSQEMLHRTNGIVMPDRQEKAKAGKRTDSTPTPKVAGSNPVGHTTKNRLAMRIAGRLLFVCLPSN